MNIPLRCPSRRLLDGREQQSEVSRLRLPGTIVLLLLVAGCNSEKPEPAEVPGKAKPPALSDVDPAEAPSLVDDEGFTKLTLADFAFHPETGSDSWIDSKEWIACNGFTKGYVYTKKKYDNFTLRFAYHFPKGSEKNSEKPPNSGVLVYIQEPHKVWPACLEVQGRVDEMANVKSNSKAITVEVKDNEEARQKNRKPVGEWNEIEIVSKAGALTAKLNGEIICTSQATKITSGPIGLQSEGFEVRFRNLRIKTE